MTKWIVSGGTLVVGLTAILTFWGTYGWITRDAYAQDEQKEVLIHENQATSSDITKLFTEIRIARVEQKMYHDEWKCDEADESVIEISMEMAVEADRRRMIMLTNELKKVEEVREDLNCSQFTD